MNLFRGFILLSSLSYAAWMDWKAKRIPNTIIAFMLATGGILLSAEILFCGQGWRSVLDAAAGFAAGGGLFFTFYLVSGGGIGAGDVKLAAAIGFFLGSRSVLMMCVSAFLLAGCACALLLLRRRTGPLQGIPLAPFMLSGTVLVMLLGM